MFNGEIVFSISDSKYLEVDFGAEIMPSKIVNKGDLIALGRKAPKNIWMYKVVYGNENEYIERLEFISNQLCERAKYINELVKIYEEVSVVIYIRSEFAEIGFAIPSYILKKFSLLDCSLDFNILSFGMVIDN